MAGTEIFNPQTLPPAFPLLNPILLPPELFRVHPNFQQRINLSPPPPPLPSHLPHLPPRVASTSSSYRWSGCSSRTGQSGPAPDLAGGRKSPQRSPTGRSREEEAEGNSVRMRGERKGRERQGLVEDRREEIGRIGNNSRRSAGKRRKEEREASRSESESRKKESRGEKGGEGRGKVTCSESLLKTRTLRRRGEQESRLGKEVS
eukprot:764856-Hanusia_phi.AAC.2